MKNDIRLELGNVRKASVRATTDEFGNEELIVRLYKSTDRHKPAPVFSTMHGTLRLYKSKWIAEFQFAPGLHPEEIADLLEEEASDMADWLAYDYEPQNGKEAA